MALPLTGAVPGPSVHPTALPHDDLRWRFQTTCPRDWWAALLRCGGGFFHSPLALTAVAPAGRAVFAQLLHDQEVVGVAAGVMSACSVSRQPLHVYLPTTPALICMSRREGALRALRESLAAGGAADLTMDAYDARWGPEAEATGGEEAMALEYVVPLDGDPAAVTRGLSASLRAVALRGEQQGWRLSMHHGSDAWALLSSPRVAAAAEARAVSAGVAGAGWTVTGFAAWDGTTPLAAALVGQSARRAYCLKRSVTPVGTRREAEVWLQWRIMCHLAEQDCDAYNLGATPATAALPSDPAHAECRLRAGLGAAVERRIRARWTLLPAHLAAHGSDRWSAPPVRLAS